VGVGRHDREHQTGDEEPDDDAGQAGHPGYSSESCAAWCIA
jgi:hypothetical protein